jgi:hypothetical protein
MPQSKFQKLVNNRFLFGIYLFKSLPAAFFAGIRVQQLDDEKAIVTVKYKWLTQNPFRSMYFACQAMAAEMTTGLLVMNSIENSGVPISMLIVKNQSVFLKKATGKITFICNDGNHIKEQISKLKNTNEGITSDLKSIGVDEIGDIVAEFVFTWSLKSKSKKP